MKNTVLILELIIKIISQTHAEVEIPYQVINLFDQRYPTRLRPYGMLLPYIAYYGDINLLINCSAVIVTSSPSFYAQKTRIKLQKTSNIIGIGISPNYPTKIFYMYDIIYCNDISSAKFHPGKLIWSTAISLPVRYQLELVALLINQLFVLEGIPSRLLFKLVTDCLDLGHEVMALPSNIYIGSSLLPNILLDDGVKPLILHEN